MNATAKDVAFATDSLKISPLPAELAHWKEIIEKYARDAGLDFFPVSFEVLDWKQMNEIAAYGGFPNRYPHWRFGMEYEELSKSYAYGLSKIYEMVINNNPSYAYLLHCNALVDQKLVMAHVYAHVDFFKNNVYFAHTNRKMVDTMANHKVHIQRYIDRYGRETVENFIDTCLSLDNLIDYHAPAIKRQTPTEEIIATDEEEPSERISVTKLASKKQYMEKFINPEEFLEAQRQEVIKERKKLAEKFPVDPVKDVLGFLMEVAPLKPWQRDVVSIVRDEAMYFAPQGQTKIMNEGWASYWHAKLMTEKILNDSEFIDFADHHSGTVAQHPGRLNPYKLGLELFRDIEDRWNKGRFGKEYDDCDDMVTKAKWDTGAGIGREKIFEVRRLYCDLTFLDTFLTPEFCERHKLFSYNYKEPNKRYEISSREFNAVKNQLLGSLSNFGQPYISLVDANYKNRAELLLEHSHFGVDLDVDYARDVMRNLFTLWKRPVHVLTKVGDEERRYSFDGKEFSES